MQELVGYCIATVYLAENEAFGISPVESLAAGKPVIGLSHGGVAETVNHGVNGVLLNPQCSVDALCTAIEELNSKYALALRQNCESTSHRFSKTAFLEAIKVLPL